MSAISAYGWAVVDGGKINVRTVSDTRRAAIINWLVVDRHLAVAINLTDEEIELLWYENGRRGVEVDYVTINRGAHAT